MALNKLKFNSLNVTAAAGKTVGFNSNANGLEASLQGGSMRLIKKLTASSDSTLSFQDGSSDVVLDSTYKVYLFILNILMYQIQIFLFLIKNVNYTKENLICLLIILILFFKFLKSILILKMSGLKDR